MACYHPSKVGVLRRSLSEASRRSDTVTVPCGSCLGCRMDQARGWSVRIMHESEYPRMQPVGDLLRASWFATLTYSDENLPGYRPYSEVPPGSLDPKDPRLFLARLRKSFPPRSLSYYLCGEYGEDSDRPHYHAVLFGPEFLDRELHTRRHGAPVWIAQAVQDAWGMGITEVTPLTIEGARYTAGYVRKKVRRKDARARLAYERVVPETGEVVNLVPEFSRMSRNPAIGKRWIERYWRDVYPRDVVVVDGQEVRPPRYYDKWMDQHYPAIMDEVRAKRAEEVVQIDDEQLLVSEKVHQARMSLFSPRATL